MSTNANTTDNKGSPGGPSTLRRLLWHPYLHIVIAAFCVTAAEVLFKQGAEATKDGAFGVSVLGSVWTWMGIGPYIVSFIIWLNVLRRVPLHIAFSIMSITQVLVPLSAWWFRAEHVSPYRWAGILVVLIGIFVVARPAMKAEEEL